MRWFKFAGLVVCAALGIDAWADVAAPIAAVTLYPGSATIVRVAQVAPGATRIVIPGLPARFDAQTLRADAGPGIRVGDIVVQDAAQSTAVNPAEADLDARIQALQDQQATLDAEAKSAEIVKSYLERLSADGGTANDKPRAPMDAKTLTGLVDALGRGASDVMGKLHRIEIQKREIRKKIDALQRDLARLRSGLKDTRTVTIHLAAEKAGDVKLSYQVHSAGWKPSYRASLNSTASRIELERLAMISQKTGEDWSNVKLTLSTGQPRHSPHPADPKPWLLSYRPPVAEESRMPAYAPAPSPVAAKAASRQATQSLDEDAPYQPPTFETHGAYATEFEVPAHIGLPSDGREVMVPLAKQTLAARQYLQVAPRLEAAAMVIGAAERPQGVWPAGGMQLFRDGNYVGNAHWNPQATDRFEFSFGRDELLRVTVDQIKGKSGGTGIFDKRIERKMADVFTLTNAHKTAVDVLVLESSPVSTSDEIKVKAEYDPKPSIESWRQRRGVMAWERKIGAGETARLTVEYTIEHPKEGIVSGMR